MKISRRHLLRGVGASFGLPLLEAMAAPAAAPKRLMVVYAPSGKIMPYWTPSATGTDFALPRTLAPLVTPTVATPSNHASSMSLAKSTRTESRAPASLATRPANASAARRVNSSLSRTRVCGVAVLALDFVLTALMFS